MVLRERAFVPTLVFIGLVISIVSRLGAPLVPDIARELGTSLGSAQCSATARTAGASRWWSSPS